MKILIIDSDEMDRRNLPLAFRKYFSEAEIFSAFCLDSVQRKAKENTFDIVLIDNELKDPRGIIASSAYLFHTTTFIRKSLSRYAKILVLFKGDISKLGHIFHTNGEISKRDLFISPMAVNQITTDLVVEPMSYHHSF